MKRIGFMVLAVGLFVCLRLIDVSTSSAASKLIPVYTPASGGTGYILGAEAGGGVFAIGYCDDEYQKSMLLYYKMGEGPFYLFYRPYHLCHVEAMTCVAEAFLNGKSLLQPEHGFRTNVYAYAKCDLRKGERLDGIGGYTCYGLIEDCAQNEDPSGLPICLAEDITLVRDVSKDEKILMSDIQYDPHRLAFELYAKAVRCSMSKRS